jgi:hypothetical protein
MGTWLQYLRGCQKPEGFARHNHNLRELEMLHGELEKLTPASLAGLFPLPPSPECW